MRWRSSCDGLKEYDDSYYFICLGLYNLVYDVVVHKGSYGLEYPGLFSKVFYLVQCDGSYTERRML